MKVSSLSLLPEALFLTASISTFGLSTNARAAAPPFTFAPAVVSPTLLPGTFTADTLAGVSSELLTIGPTGSTGQGYLLFTTATLNNSVVPAGFSQSGNPAPGQYNFYVTFQLADNGTGAIGSVATVTVFNFQMFVDYQKDDTFTPATVVGGSGKNPLITGNANDALVAFGTLVAGSGVDGFDSLGGAFFNSTELFNVCTGANTAMNGSTNVAAGSATFGTNGQGCTTNYAGFFAAPIPFDSLARFNFNNNGGQSVQRISNQIAIGSAGSVSFNDVPESNKVPEPSTLALFGFAATGLFASRRCPSAGK